MYYNIVGLSIILITCYTSYKGFQSEEFFNQFSFQIDRIQVHREYARLITSGFLHADWAHLIFNMIALSAFASGLEISIGITKLLVIYLGSLVGGNLLALFLNRHNSSYTAVGASGAISGLVYGSISLFPGISLGLLLLPISIPGWLFGLLYTLYTIYGIRSKKDNIGHEAHLGGGLTGMAIALMFYPDAVWLNTLPILLILIPSLLFLYLVFTHPAFLFTGTITRDTTLTHTLEDRYHTRKRNDERELNRLLEKIHKKGVDSLSPGERETLERLSKKM